MAWWFLIVAGLQLGALAGAPEAGWLAWAMVLGGVLGLASWRGLAVVWIFVLATLWGGAAAPTAIPLGGTGGPIRVSGYVATVSCGHPKEGCRVRLDSHDLSVAAGVPIHVKIRPVPDGLVPGAELSFRAELRLRSDRTNPGFASPLARERRALVSLGRVEEVHVSAPSSLPLRAGARARLRLGGGDAEALFAAMLLGERADMGADLRNAFADTGTAHLLAISGLHVGVIGWSVFRLLLWFLLGRLRIAQAGRPEVPAALAAGAFTWFYVLLVAPSDATLRAAIMITVILAARVLERRPFAPRTIAAAALAVLLVEPTALWDASFQRSFAAAGALVASAPLYRSVHTWLKEPGRLPSPRWSRAAAVLVGLTGATTISFVATAPLSLAWFGQLAPVGLLVNLVAVPLTSLVVLPAGLLWLLLALMAPDLAAALTFIPELAADALLGIVSGWADLCGPATTSAWPHAVGALAAAAVVAAFAKRWKLGVALGAAGLSLALLTTGGGGLEVTFLEVGHGDAAVVVTPEERYVLVDTGGTWRGGDANQAIAERRLVPALTRLGASELDLLVLTHSDHDHVGAAPALARRLRVRELWVCACAGQSAAVRETARIVAAGGGRVRVVGPSAGWDWGGAKWRVLGPPVSVATADGRCRVEDNDSSIVLSVGWAGRQLLLTGDISAKAERELVMREGGVLGSDVLKSPHHGSRSSSSEALLDAVRPTHVVVSGVLHRKRMPPHSDVLRRYLAAGMRVWVTSRDGAVTMRVERTGRLKLWSRR